MADTPVAAPAAPTSNPAQSAVSEVTKTLPTDQKPPVQAKTTDDVVDDTGDDLPVDEAKETQKKKDEAAAAAAKKYKLKVGGKDLDVDESELLRRAQMGTSADQKWQEAAHMRKQVEQFIQLMQTDPWEAMRKAGHDIDKMAEDRIKARIEEMQKSPEQLERERAQKELADLKAEREREKAEAQEREKVRVQEQFAIEIENDISSALDNNEYGFPKTPYVVKRIADMMIMYLGQAMDPNSQISPAQRERLKKITAKDVLPLVRDEIRAEQREMYAASPDEVFEELIGKDRLNKYRRNKIKKTAKPASVNDVKPTGTSQLQRQEDNKPKEKIRSKDFFKTLGSR